MSSTRRLLTRRGSVSAADPHGAHANLSRNVQSSSTLTIVRVISSPPQTDPVPRTLHRRGSDRRSSSSDRLSFAVSSFGPPSPTTSPSSSPRIRPSSPHRLSANFPSAPRLSPDQLVDLARSATNQRAHEISHSPQTRASSPSAHPHHSSTLPTFTPLPDDILLPFIDRPSEVAALISTPPSAKLFSLLQKTLAPITEPSSDPSKWTYTQLHEHLTQVSRQQASDVIWVLKARRCIMSHSELIWERVKGALGVPPELDVDYDPSDPMFDNSYDYSSSHSSIDTDELSDDFGRSARGHWEDWDAIMDSPVHDRRHSGPSSPILPLSLARQEDEHTHLDCRDSEHHPVSPSSTLLSIEPLLAPSPSSQHFSPSNYSTSGGMLATSEIGGLVLDDIQEGAEEDEESTTSTTDDTPTTEKNLELNEPNDAHLIAPSQIQGLRISTTPTSSSLQTALSTSSSTGSALGSGSGFTVKPLSPISPLPPYHYPVPRERPVSGTFVRPSVSVSVSGSAGSDGYASDASERIERSPLFPSSFARLRLGGESMERVVISGGAGGKKQRTCSHGADAGGSVAGYKRLSWGAAGQGV